jgi:hypothetical protein
MEIKNIIFLTILVVIYVIISMWYVYSEVQYIESDIDKRVYKIRSGKMKSNGYLKETANMLAEINNRVMKLITYLDEKYKDDNNKNYYIKMLDKNYKPDILSEAAIDNRYTTYTVDKQDMHICLRTRDHNEKLYDINILMYVILHELAHLCNYDRNGNPITGHGYEFKNIFRLLVEESIKIGVYEYKNYQKQPVEYCGMIINSTIV